MNIYFRYLAFDHSFRCWLKVSLLRGGFSEVGGVVTSRQILLVGVVTSRLILRGWRIIEAPACLVGGLSRLLLVWLEDYLVLLVWLVLQVVLLAAEARFN